jgi:predicted MPP superfamily phosphohydrolase
LHYDKKKEKHHQNVAYYPDLRISLCTSGPERKMEETRYTYTCSKLPEGFRNFKILLISDLHNKQFGSKQAELIKAIRNESPDIIFLTGDILDKYQEDIVHCKELFQGIADIAPIYFVTGNHETAPESRTKYEQLQDLMPCTITLIWT